jgi:hypothetical protein
MSKTYIEELKEDVKVIVNKEEDDRKIAIDLFLPLTDRLSALSRYYHREGEAVGELISSIIGMYFFSKTRNLTEYINAICEYKEIPLSYRIECSKNLDKGGGHKHIDSMFMQEGMDMAKLPTPIRVDAVVYLMKSDEFKENAREYFCNIILDEKIEPLYRYRTIQSLERHFKGAAFLFYTKESCYRFMTRERMFTYRVIACQYLLEKCSPDRNMVDEIESFLLSSAEDATLDEDLRADACDILLQYGGDKARESAQTALYVLGGGDRSRNNIFKNKQNVHVRSIEESVERIVNDLSTYHPSSGIYYTFDKAREAIMKIVSTNDTNDKNDEHLKKEVEGALIRISIDRAVYGNSNMTLTSTLAKIWTYIQDSEHRSELENRLIEELVEANNKCSSGYAARLVNTLSGYDEKMSIKISFEDQIIANLEGRLNKAILELSEEDEMDNVLSEMSLPVINYHLRGNFLKFFREHISVIREEMYQEFREHMEDIDYDFYFRKAIIHYEGCK